MFRLSDQPAGDMMHKYNTLMLLILSSLFMQCDSPTVGTDDTATVIPKYDLTVGNSWTYTTKIYNNNGAISSTYNMYTKVLRESTIVGEKWSLLSVSMDSNSTRVATIAREQGDGYYERKKYYNAPLMRESDTSLLVYKYPAPANSKYLVNPSYDIEAKNLNSDTATIVSRSIRVTVPAGTFNCYWYKTVHNISSRDSAGNAVLFPLYYLDEFVSDSGLVKVEGYSILPGGPKLALSYELNTFSIH